MNNYRLSIVRYPLKKEVEARPLSGFYSFLLLFFLRLKAIPKPAAVIEPRIVSGSGTAEVGAAGA